MQSRMKGMWWGTAIEAPDPGALARFYSELLGWPIGHEEAGTAIIAAPEGSIYVVFQLATDYQAPTWPPVEGEQRPMMHFDFQVGDLDSAVAEAVALGATRRYGTTERDGSGAVRSSRPPVLSLPGRLTSATCSAVVCQESRCAARGRRQARAAS